MESQVSQKLHFIMLPFLAQGHMIPMIDMARLLAQRGVIVTIVTTPINAARFQSVVTRSVQSGLQIRLIDIPFPCKEVGLPEGCENFDMLPSMDQASNFGKAIAMLRVPFEDLLNNNLTPKPSCIISDMSYTWTVDTASMFNVPRISFHGFCCFCLLCVSKVHENNVTSDLDYFVVRGLPGDEIEISRAQMPFSYREIAIEFGERVSAADIKSYGVIINTFEELESAYVKEYRKVKNGKVWCLGPVSLCNKEFIDKIERGNKALIDAPGCLNWLDSFQPGSVVYVCLGSLCNLTTSQLIELGLGLEASKKPFIWVLRGGYKSTDQLKNWFSETNFEERTNGRGLLIRGWAPQVLILSHPAIGGFLTHCGWNSSLEAISSGVPMLTWPLFGDQFCNEKLIVQILRIGVRVGVEVPLDLGEEEQIGLLVKKEDVERSINILMDPGEEKDLRIQRAREFKELANKALGKGGSSFLNTASLIQDIMEQAFPLKK